MDALTTAYLTGLAADLSAALAPRLARRLREAWQGDASERAVERCLYAGLVALAMEASAAAPDEEALLEDIFRDFFHDPEVYPHLTTLARGKLPDIDELAFLFREAGYEQETLPALDFAQGVKAFSAAFLARAAGEEALQGTILAAQTLEQTRLLRGLAEQVRELAAILEKRPDGRIQAGNYVVGTQIIYQWGGGAAPQTLETAYLKTLIGRCNRLDLAEVDERLMAGDEEEVKLSDVFTTLYAARGEQVITRRPEQTAAEALRRPDELGDDDRRTEEDAEPLPAASAAGALERLVILGHPGGGKSTLVNYLATQLARQRLPASPSPLPDWPADPPLPVRIILRRFAAWLAGAVGDEIPAAKEGLVWRYLEEKLLADWGCPDAYPVVRRILLEEGGVIFFDGLDEVPESVDDARRTLIKDAIADFARPLDRCKVIVTCREYAYKKDDAWRLPEARFPVIDLALFQEEQIRQFAATWYRVMGPRLEWDREKQEDEAERLAGAVIAQSHLQELGQYPLLLTLMAQVHGRYGDLPENRADLYDRAVNLLLSHWENRIVREIDGRRRVEPGLIARLDLRREEVRSVLAQIAFAAHERQEKQGEKRDSRAADIGRDELWEGLLPLVDSYDRAKIVTAYIQGRSGLLQARERFTYTFPHRTFQEYLAAAHVWSLPEDPVEALYRRLERDPAWWREIFLLAAGQARGDAYRVKSLVDRLAPTRPDEESVSDWALARVRLAAQTVHETNFMRFVRGQGEDHPYVLLVERVRAWLETALVAEESLPSAKRAEAGQALGRWFKDTRPGVGVIERDGVTLPDILWGGEVPAGTYTIGGDERARRSFEERQVTIPHDYRLSRYPITNVQFNCFLEAPDWDDARWWEGIPEKERQFDSPYFPYGNHPRERVSWYQALAFCRWLTAKLHAGALPAGSLSGDREGYIITLPHEYEWEVAARWPNEDVGERLYPWGAEFDAKKANTSRDIGITTAVGMYPSGKNVALGLYDMSGNVREWCRNPYYEPDEDVDPQDVDPRYNQRVLRGGSWLNGQNGTRSAYRDYHGSGFRDNEFGFRVVCVACRPVRP